MQVRRHFAFAILWGATCGWAQNSSPAPVWWAKYQYLSQHAADAAPAKTASLVVGSNVDVSNECGPQSETFITLNPAAPAVLAAGSNEIFRDPMRGYFSSDGGGTWGGVNLPLPPTQGGRDPRFASSPRRWGQRHATPGESCPL